MSASYTIAKLAEAAGVHVETIRYYQRRGLLVEPARLPRSIRHYGVADVERLRFIKRAKAVGFTLEEVATLLAMRLRKHCGETRAFAAHKLEIIDRQLSELQGFRADLSQWIDDCDANAANHGCPVIEHLEAGDSNRRAVK